MTTWSRDAVARQLHGQLLAMDRDADHHKPYALQRRARLRQGVGVPFGDTPAAAAELLAMIDLEGDGGGPPPLTANLERLLEDALTVASLVAFTRIGVRDRDAADHRRDRWGSFGNDLRPLRATRPAAVESLAMAVLGAGRESLPRYLRRAMSLMSSDGHRVDVHALVRDLGNWTHEDRRVQRRWAYDLWARADARRDSDTPTDKETT